MCAERCTYGSGGGGSASALLAPLRTVEGFAYFAVDIDLYSRRVNGWTMQCRQFTDVVLQALLMAVGRRKPKDQVLVHPMSRRGNCHDNAVAESFFNILKRERIPRKVYRSRGEARQDVFDYIEMFYTLNACTLETGCCRASSSRSSREPNLTRGVSTKLGAIDWMKRMYRLPLRLLDSMSALGTLLALLFFAASLTPSLMPRPWMIQGLLSGSSAAIGYLFGAFLSWLWRYLGLPSLKRYVLIERAFTLTAALLASLLYLWQTVDWQNSIRQLWHMELLDSADPMRLASVAGSTFIVLLVAGRLFRLAVIRVSAWLKRYVPPRVSNVLSAVVAVVFFWSVLEGVFLRAALDAADASFQKADELMEAEMRRPDDPSLTGSAASLISWEGLGRQGATM